MAGIYRRICLLRANGQNIQADRVQLEELDPARRAAEIETRTGNSPETEALIKALFDNEEARVAEALLFAEVLAPLIAERIRPALVLEPVASRAPFPSDRERRPSSSPATREPADTAPNIADLIDGMLGQERRKPSH